MPAVLKNVFDSRKSKMGGRIETVGRTVNVKIKVGVADFHF